MLLLFEHTHNISRGTLIFFLLCILFFSLSQSGIFRTQSFLLYFPRSMVCHRSYFEHLALPKTKPNNEKFQNETKKQTHTHVHPPNQISNIKKCERPQQIKIKSEFSCLLLWPKRISRIFSLFYFRIATHPRNAYTHICNLNSVNIRVREFENRGCPPNGDGGRMTIRRKPRNKANNNSIEFYLFVLTLYIIPSSAFYSNSCAFTSPSN